MNEIMGSSENLLKAAFNRISARLGQQIIDKANDLSKKAKDTPDQLKAEWDILKKEIITEANRLDETEQANNSITNQSKTYKERVNAIRSKISLLSEKIEGIN